MTDALHINGHSIKFVDRKLWKQRGGAASVKSDELALVNKRKCPEVIDAGKRPRKRRILKRPKLFKNYYTDRQPLSIPRFEFPRLGEQHPFRGRQTICKFYDHNEIINDQLIQIKSAQTVRDFERIFNEQLRHDQLFPKSAKSIEPYYDTKEILAPPLRPFASETCLCTRDDYRLDQLLRHRISPFASTKTTTAATSGNGASLNAIKGGFGASSKGSSFEDFLHLASECYDKCIQCYLASLDECNRTLERIESQSPACGKAPSLRTHPIGGENLLAHRFSRLSINLDTSRGLVTSSTSHDFTPPKAPTIAIVCSQRAMSCNDSNNNSTDSTNQLKDPPKIVFSDFSSTTKQASGTQGGDSDNGGDTDKNCLTIPITSYCSEARPP